MVHVSRPADIGPSVGESQADNCRVYFWSLLTPDDFSSGAFINSFSRCLVQHLSWGWSRVCLARRRLAGRPQHTNSMWGPAS